MLDPKMTILLTPCSHHALGYIRVSKRRLWCAYHMDTQSERVKRAGGPLLPYWSQGWEAGRMAELLERAMFPRMVIMEEQEKDGRLMASLPCWGWLREEVGHWVPFVLQYCVH